MTAVKEHVMSCHILHDVFKISFPDQKVQLIVDNTNIQHVKDILPAYYNKSDKNTFISSLDQGEFYAFIGLLYTRGFLRQSIHTYKMVFFPETAGHPVFSATMLKHRFFFLCLVMSFADPEERRELWTTDRFATARALTNILINQMRSVLVPSEYFLIHETL